MGGLPEEYMVEFYFYLWYFLILLKEINLDKTQTITQLWLEKKEAFQEKALKQVLSFTGKGELKDNSATSQQFREFLGNIPTKLLREYGEECLTRKFPDSGYALQDIINQTGSRLDFNVEYGLYKGKKNAIGFDGIWKSKDDYSLVVEVKTTDVYRMNLDKFSEYRNRLIEEKKIGKENSSILFVVGREDTGDFEVQIRGSRHAWDVRLISVDSLFQLLELKENLNDLKTLQLIKTLLKPIEYTKIDRLLDLIFLTSKDMQSEDAEEMMTKDDADDKTNKNGQKKKKEPVNFHEDCISKVENHLKMNLLKNIRTTYVNHETKTRFTCSISKTYTEGKWNKYWYAFHPHQREYMEEVKKGYVILGCGSAKKILLIPFAEFKSWIKSFWTTEKDQRMYWHVHIKELDGKFYIQQPKLKKGKTADITKYRI